MRTVLLEQRTLDRGHRCNVTKRDRNDKMYLRSSPPLTRPTEVWCVVEEWSQPMGYRYPHEYITAFRKEDHARQWYEENRPSEQSKP